MKFYTAEESISKRKPILLCALDSVLVYKTKILKHELPSAEICDFHQLRKLPVNRWPLHKTNDLIPMTDQTLISDNPANEELDVCVLRPWVRSFLLGLSRYFQIGVIVLHESSTILTRSFTHQILDILDPDHSLIADRVIWSRSEIALRISDPRLVCLIDTPKYYATDCWRSRESCCIDKNHEPNLLIPVQPFHHDMTNRPHPETTTLYLPKLRSILEEIHHNYFNYIISSDNWSVDRPFPDLRSSLSSNSQADESDFEYFLSQSKLEISDNVFVFNDTMVNESAITSQLSEYSTITIDDTGVFTDTYSPSVISSDYVAESESSTIDGKISPLDVNTSLFDIYRNEYKSILRLLQILKNRLTKLTDSDSKSEFANVLCRWNYLVRRKDFLFRSIVCDDSAEVDAQQEIISIAQMKCNHSSIERRRLDRINSLINCQSSMEPTMAESTKNDNCEFEEKILPPSFSLHSSHESLTCGSVFKKRDHCLIL